MQLQILVVEDDKDMLKMMVEVLELYLKIPVKIRIAQNGEEAVIQCEKQFFDLIITDINMPKMDGIEFIKKIVSNKKEMYSKIYVHSGRLANETQEVLNLVDKYYTKGDKNPLDIIKQIRIDFPPILRENY